MKFLYTSALAILFFTSAISQSNLNVSLVGQLGYDQAVNDIWGYAAPDGSEYALVCVQNGVSIVSLADPANPEELFFVSGANSGWRDIKTWGTFAYVTNETSGGLAVIDLANLPDAIDSWDWTPNIPGLGTLSSCHNLFIDEFGYAYLAGCNLNSGGILFVDVFTEPGSPSYAGKARPVYSHDAYARGNILYSADINAGVFSVHDVSDKQAATLLATHPTPAAFTHNCWLSDDGAVLFTTDETGDAPIAAYDVSDLNNIRELDQYRPFATLGEGVIPHNVHVWDDYLIVSYYTDGCIVLDASRPDNLVEVGNFDTFLGASGGFSGAWGAYPFLPSRLILVSDRGNGLYVLQPNYVRACYLEGQVSDTNGNGLLNAKVKFVDELPFAETDFSGGYKTGIATAGSYTVEVSKLGYQPVQAMVEMENGQVTLLNVELEALESFTLSGSVTGLDSGEPVAGALVQITGEEVSYEAVSEEDGTFLVSGVFAGTYEVAAGKWGYRTVLAGTQDIDAGNPGFEIELEKGIEDIFMLDLGWTVSGNAFFGKFQLAVPPIGVSATLPSGQSVTIQPGQDSEDPGNGCYVTGNTSDLQQGVLVTGITRLNSPLFDVSTMGEPWVSFESWLLTVNPNTLALGNDEIVVKISNGDTTVTVTSIGHPGVLGQEAWQYTEFKISDFIAPGSQMQAIFEVNGGGTNDVGEAAIDNFLVFDTGISAVGTLDPGAFELKAFPNPSSAAFQLAYHIEEWQEDAQLVVYNLLGQKAETMALRESEGQVEVGRNLEKGIYFVRIEQRGQVSAGLKLIRQ
ncbi:MAG: choice-of-anchor B family protein [Phaeodactylibacter sp.]|nr:choice-of-anchor B family protein [Phaeodactylibacter sp.]MCB9052861.1 choice-of-anchor B family protein [Lewinellaceae bacterium]